MDSIYQFSVTDIDGHLVDLNLYKGATLLIVNTASKKHNLKHLRQLQILQDRFGSDSFTILAFPCRQFLKQESKQPEKIKTLYYHIENVTFPVFSLTEVNGPNAIDLYKWLKNRAPGKMSIDVEWNYTKFLIYPNGKTVLRLSSVETFQNVSQTIENVLVQYIGSASH